MTMRLDPRAEAAFAADMSAELGIPAPRPAPAAQRPRPSMPQLRAGDVHLGDADTGEQIGLDPGKLVDGRLLIQGASGAGKSWTLRRLLEQTAGAIQQIVIDPEGEFLSLAERFNYAVIDAARLDPAAVAIAARRAREHRLSVLLDLSELEREAQMQMVAAFLAALIDAPREQWTPALVAIDEAHLFAPFGGQAVESTSVRKAAIAAVTDLMSRGRKRGLAGVLATQRLARLAKSVASEVHSFLIGLNTLDLDIRRAAETIGWDARRAFDRLPMLVPGDFVAVGPAFSRSPAVVRVGPIETRHRGAAPALLRPEKIAAEDAARLLDIDGLAEEAARDRETRGEITPGVKAVRQFIRDPSFALAGRIFEALRPLSPDGAALADLASHLGATAEDVASAIALLDQFGSLEIDGDGAQRAVRIGKGMA
jgi:DNA helicase HerA-like ATPase